jgi:hypothetical protein
MIEMVTLILNVKDLHSFMQFLRNGLQHGCLSQEWITTRMPQKTGGPAIGRPKRVALHGQLPQIQQCGEPHHRPQRRHPNEKARQRRERGCQDRAAAARSGPVTFETSSSSYKFNELINKAGKLRRGTLKQVMKKIPD